MDLIHSGRAVGNTTRLADKLIQDLFDGKIIETIDHYQYGANKQANENLFDRIIRRLQLEHSGLFHNKQIHYDRTKLRIKIER